MEDKLIREYLGYLNVKAFQAKGWINYLYTLSNKISTDEANSADYSCFWIRLNGLISEVQKYFQLFKGKDGIDTILNIKNTEYVQIATDISKVIDSICQKLTTDDKTIITYERNCQTHAFQNDYIPKIELINGKYSITKQKKKQAFSDISILVAKYPINILDMDRSLAKYFVNKIKPELDNLKNTIDNWLDWAN